ncbi:Methyltransferase domain-containing protein [Halovenus aranensis]|uniref:Methyltransferase domain-containing protein n=1 Tax=Halovenus aranensis TaxID=890420 RepID=A0A1G8W553_9EURY|nr:class I SAM-dependent methyltransferase [Halovenus aranensis]SDJ73451.1 Methyltransferase domain-containing protein [Halovenus aranensis]
MSNTDNPLVAGLYDPVMAIPERTVLRPHREALVADLAGDVLDLGAGTGALFQYVESRDVTSVCAVEPDPGMRRQAIERAEDLSADITVTAGDAQALPYDDRSFDAVIASFALCTIPDHEQALAEVARVLRGGGEFRFLEHVRGDGLSGRVHDLLAPGWHAVAGGCHLNRETDRLLLGDDRFRTISFERTDGLTDTLLPVVRGRLERQRSDGGGTLDRVVAGLTGT